MVDQSVSSWTYLQSHCLQNRRCRRQALSPRCRRERFQYRAYNPARLFQAYPTNPFPTPVRKPAAPPVSAPSRGLVCSGISCQLSVSAVCSASELAYGKTLKTTCNTRHERCSARGHTVESMFRLVAILPHASLVLVLLIKRCCGET